MLICWMLIVPIDSQGDVTRLGSTGWPDFDYCMEPLLISRRIWETNLKPRGWATEIWWNLVAQVITQTLQNRPELAPGVVNGAVPARDT